MRRGYGEQRDTQAQNEHFTVTGSSEVDTLGPQMHVELLKSEISAYVSDNAGGYVPNMRSRWQQFKKERFEHAAYGEDPKHIRYFGIVKYLQREGFRVVGEHSGNYDVDGHDNVIESFPKAEDRWGRQEREVRENYGENDGDVPSPWRETPDRFRELYERTRRREDALEAHERWVRNQIDKSDDDEDEVIDREEVPGSLEDDDFDGEEEEDDLEPYIPLALSTAEEKDLQHLMDVHSVRAGLVISRVDAIDKYSEGYMNCLGIAAFGTDKKTGEPVSLLAHINPVHMQVTDPLSKEFAKNIVKACKELAYVCVPGTVQITLFGGKFHHNESAHSDAETNHVEKTGDEIYRDGIRTIAKIVASEFGAQVDPLIISQPITFAHNKVHAYVDTKNRTVVLARPEHQPNLHAWERKPIRASELLALDDYSKTNDVLLNTHVFGKRGDEDAIHPPRGIPNEAGNKDFW